MQLNDYWAKQSNEVGATTFELTGRVNPFWNTGDGYISTAGSSQECGRLTVVKNVVNTCVHRRPRKNMPNRKPLSFARAYSSVFIGGRLLIISGFSCCALCA